MEQRGDLIAVERGALLSADLQYRYRLWRIWNIERAVMVWVLLNPSTADASADDQTVRANAAASRR